MMTSAASTRLQVHAHTPMVGWWVTATLASFVIAAGLLAVALASGSHPASAVVWGGLAVGAYAFGLLCLAGGGQGALLGLGRWRVGSWIMLWYGIAYGVTTVGWVHLPLDLQGEIPISSVQCALWLVAAGTTAWTGGYLAGASGLVQDFAKRADAAMGRRFAPEVRASVTPWLLFAIGASARLLRLVITGAYGHLGNLAAAPSVAPATPYQQAVILLGYFGTFGVASAALQVFRERRPGSRVTLITLFCLDLAFDAASGAKSSFALTFLAILIPFCAARRRFPVMQIALTLIVSVAVVIPVTRAYRNESFPTGTRSVATSITVAPSMLARAATSGRGGGDVQSPSTMSYVFQRASEISSPAIIMQRTPSQIRFVSPLMLIESPVLDGIPRLIWRNKPAVDDGYQFSRQYFNTPASEYTSTAVTPIGDLYRHGGWLPVIAGMFVLGLGVRLLDDACNIRENPCAIFLILIFAPALIISETGWAPLLGGIPWSVLIWLLAAFLAFRRKYPAQPHEPRVGA